MNGQPPGSPVRSAQGRRLGPLAWLPPLALAAAIYRPWRILPFDVWDFVEFMPILSRTNGVLARFGALLHYYATDGRMNPLFYFTFDLFYSLFHAQSAGWQLVRFGVMAVDVMVLVFLVRRLGLGTIAALGAAGVLVTATPAVRAWVQLMAEPQALLALLIAVWLALDYGTTMHWRRRSVAIVALIAAAFLSKEITGSLGVVIVAVALFWTPGVAWSERLRFRRNLVLAAGALAVAIAEAAMLLAVRAAPTSTGYGMMYGTGPKTFARLSEIVVAIMLPVRPGLDSRFGLLYPANVLAILVLALGVTAYRRRRGSFDGLGMPVALGLLPVLVGALVYWPWPKFDTFYALPFFVGPLLLYAAALHELVRAGGSRRAFGVAAACLVPLYSAIPASRSTETAAASLNLNAGFARLLSRFQRDDTFFVVDPEEGARVLPVSPDGLRDYAVMLGWADSAKAPTLLAPACNAYPPDVAADTTHRAFGSYSYGCGRFPNPTLRMAAPYTWRDWLTLEKRTDTLTLDLTGGLIRRRLFGKTEGR